MAEQKMRKLCVKRSFEIKRLIRLCCTLLATVDDWRRVADQVHWETMVVAVRPMETLPLKNNNSYQKVSLSKRLTSGVKSSVQVISVMVNVLPNLEKRFLSRLEFLCSMSLTKESHGVKIFHHCRMPHLISFAAHNICMDTRLD